jgi:hypothetical protein
MNQKDLALLVWSLARLELKPDTALVSKTNQAIYACMQLLHEGTMAYQLQRAESPQL